eukprot:TRINITY_DN1725_c0_g1_i1.p1 TRINITY_DN1725_c0_g1~~TRINITY_DN1725_c0_g1_i1.p1  ORF type:complete len:511 (+),score=88.68 TRINITY_DN1725_c0_g1_i1:127-1659(+)
MRRGKILKNFKAPASWRANFHSFPRVHMVNYQPTTTATSLFRTPNVTSPDYDLVILGSGPAGQKSAIQAAKLHKRVALVDATEMLGGTCVNTGTIPSKTLREAILYLSGFKQRFFYGTNYCVQDQIKFEDLTFRVETVIRREKEVIANQLSRNRVDVYPGLGRFLTENTIVVANQEGEKRLNAKNFLIAVGTRPARDPKIEYDGKYVFDADQILHLKELPRQLIVAGAGVIGIEYAAMLGTLPGCQVTIIDGRPDLLDFVDSEITESLMFHMRESRSKFRLGEKMSSVVVDKERGRVTAQLESGKKVIGDSLLYAVGRQCNTDALDLENAGLEADPRGKLAVNATYQTNIPHIYAAGDVIGFPSLASSSFLQGRLAVCHMFGQPYNSIAPDLIPYGIYSIPEVSMVGKTEQQLTRLKIPYEYGIARYTEMAKGMMQGAQIGGMLKILFHLETHDILGVHAIGEGATEIIHIGQAAIALGAKLNYFTENVFNFPTFAEAYQIAALDGLNKV